MRMSWEPEQRIIVIPMLCIFIDALLQYLLFWLVSLYLLKIKYYDESYEPNILECSYLYDASVQLLPWYQIFDVFVMEHFGIVFLLHIEDKLCFQREKLLQHIRTTCGTFFLCYIFTCLDRHLQLKLVKMWRVMMMVQAVRHKIGLKSCHFSSKPIPTM